MVRFTTLIAICFVLGLSGATGPAAATGAQAKFTVVKGTVYRGDKSHPAAGAVIILLDEKAGSSGNSKETKADKEGNYVFDRVAEGRYTVGIQTRHSRKEDVPCQLLVAKSKDKNSTVVILADKGAYVEQIFIKGFSIKAGKEIGRDFDIACQSAF